MRRTVKWGYYLITGIILFLIIGVWQILPGKNIQFSSTNASIKPDHKIWNELLNNYVDDNGLVDYQGFAQDRLKLQSYLDDLTTNPPDKEAWSQAEQMAFWINAYNAFTVELILEYKPPESIKDIGSKIQVPFINSPWDIEFIEIKGEKLDLNNIEHDILRNEFEEPRIHFAIVCASYSCPKLRNEAFIASKLENQLSEQASLFINDSSRNEITESSINISKIFQWFSGDFTKNRTLIDFLNKHSKTHINKDARIDYKDYDWSLNRQPGS